MKFGLRKPSLKKRLAARTSLKRVARHNLGLKAPRGWGWLTNPKRAAYNRAYSRTTFGIFGLVGALLKALLSSGGGKRGEKTVVLSSLQEEDRCRQTMKSDSLIMANGLLPGWVASEEAAKLFAERGKSIEQFDSKKPRPWLFASVAVILVGGILWVASGESSRGALKNTQWTLCLPHRKQMLCLFVSKPLSVHRSMPRKHRCLMCAHKLVGRITISHGITTQS